MMPVVKNYANLISELNKRLYTAVENVSKQMVEQLRQFLIDDYYNLYDPKKYDRTNQLMDSPTYEMLASNMAKIFIDVDSMSYKSASGLDVANLASLGFHGNTNIFREGYFWEDFINWCDNNVPTLLKTELRNQGLAVK